MRALNRLSNHTTTSTTTKRRISSTLGRPNSSVKQYFEISNSFMGCGTCQFCNDRVPNSQHDGKRFCKHLLNCQECPIEIVHKARENCKVLKDNFPSPVPEIEVCSRDSHNVVHVIADDSVTKTANMTRNMSAFVDKCLKKEAKAASRALLDFFVQQKILFRAVEIESLKSFLSVLQPSFNSNLSL